MMCQNGVPYLGIHTWPCEFFYRLTAHKNWLQSESFHGLTIINEGSFNLSSYYSIGFVAKYTLFLPFKNSKLKQYFKILLSYTKLRFFTTLLTWEKRKWNKFHDSYYQYLQTISTEIGHKNNINND